MLRVALFMMLPRAIKLRYIHVQLPGIRGLCRYGFDEFSEEVLETSSAGCAQLQSDHVASHLS